MDIIDIEVNINSSFQVDIDNLIDETTMLQVHNLLARMCDPYVPFDEGVLAQSVVITPEYVLYPGPYAHYMYVGEIYGPNIPIKDENGLIVGWFSPPGQTKHPTGRPITYGTEKHPLASKEWDKAMLANKQDEFLEQIRLILLRRWIQLHG